MILDDFSTSALVTAIEGNFRAFLPELGKVAGTEFYRDGGVEWFISGIDSPVFNHVMHTNVSEEAADAQIEAVLESVRRRGVEASWWVNPSARPGDLARRLRRRGLLHGADWAGMAADLYRLNEQLPYPAELQVDEVRDAAALQDWMEVFATGFSHDGLTARVLFDLWSGPLQTGTLPFRLYLGRMEERAVGGSLLFPAEGVAGVYCVATIPEARRRGIGARLTQVPLLRAREDGYRIGVLQATRMGHRVYEKLGFREYCRFGMYLWLNWDAPTEVDTT